MEKSGFRVIYSINLLALTEGLLLALYLKHAQVSNNAKKTSWTKGYVNAIIVITLCECNNCNYTTYVNANFSQLIAIH